MKTLLSGALLAGTVAIGSLVQVTPANAITFSGSSGTGANQLSATADVTQVGTNLQVVLTNTSTKLVSSAGDVLTGIFFDFANPAPTLSLQSVLLNTGSTVVNSTGSLNNSSVTSTTNLKVDGNSPSTVTGFVGGWQYKSSTVPGFDGGAGTAGFGIFDAQAVSGGTGNASYGLITGFSNSVNNSIADQDVINNSIILTLAGVPQNYDLSKLLNVRFQYGTALGETSIVVGNPGTPVPTPALVPAAIGAGLALLRRKKQEEEVAQDA